jgi:hypothetical protein
MIDGLSWDKNAEFQPSQPSFHSEDKHNLGIAGVWLVLGGRDYFEPFEADGIRGIKVSNSCGYFDVAAKA